MVSRRPIGIARAYKPRIKYSAELVVRDVVLELDMEGEVGNVN